MLILLQLLIIYLTRMKTIIFATVLILFASAQQDRACCSQSTVTTVGTSSVSAPPDIASISITAEQTRDTTKTAANAVNQQIARVLAVLQNNNVRPLDIKTTQVSVYPKYDYNNGKSEIVGQTASQTVTAKIRNIGNGSNVAKVIDDLSQIQNIQVGGAQFDIDNKTELNRQARTLAYADAKDKASQYAQLSGARLGAALTIQDTNSAPTFSPRPYAMAMQAAPMGGSGSSIPTGEIEINYSITVTWKLN